QNVDEEHDQGGDNRNAEDGVGESAMVDEADGAALEIPEHVDVGGFGGERHGESCKRSFAGEAGARHRGAVEEVGDGFQRTPQGRKPRLLRPKAKTTFYSASWPAWRRRSNRGRWPLRGRCYQ